MITIGVPVRNGAKTLASVFETLLRQTCDDYVVIVSDNASSDETSNICHRYQSRFKRFYYYRQPAVISIASNFCFVLQKCKTKYFMWAAADDLRSENYLEECIKMLSLNENAVAATSNDRLANSSRLRTFELKGSLETKFNKFCENAYVSNGLFYSLMVADVAKRFDFCNLDVLAGDWIFILHLAQYGDIVRSPRAFTIWGDKGISCSQNKYKIFRTKWYHWLIPLDKLMQYALSVVFKCRFQNKPSFLFKLFAINRLTAIDQINLEIGSNALTPMQTSALMLTKKILFDNIIVNRLVLALASS